MSVVVKKTDISSWLNVSETLGGSAINFVIEVGFAPTLLDISSNVLEVLGHKKEDLLKDSTNISEFIDQNEIKELFLEIDSLLLTKQKNHTLSIKLKTINNTLKPIDIFFRFLKDKKENKVLMIGYLLDVSQKRLFEDKINYLTNYDNLTGLVNRNKLKKLIDQEFKLNKTSKLTSAVLYLDLNRFKNVNDSLGHDIGDKLLLHVSHRLRSCIKSEDILARVGDDEFVILLSSLNPKTVKSHVEIIAGRVYKILDRAFSIDENVLHITTSIGVAILEDDGKDSQEILQNADTAMYLAKKDQDSYFRYYESKMQDDSNKNLEIENELRIAIKNKEFELFYQPQVDIETNLITGAEALIRWNHPQKGMISPLKFIPIAEDTGLIIEIGEWVLVEACKKIKELQNDKNTPKSFKKISVNISSKQFAQPSFTSDVIEIIKEQDIDARFLELEVTEGALIINLDEAIEKMLILKELGIRFSIDDFGTGYSSLTYLKKLPIDIIKIDKSFITNMHYDKDDRVLTQTIIQMSQNLRLGLIAEGVEMVEHLNFLQERGCQSYQGFYFSKPLPFKQFKELLFKAEKLVEEISYLML
jgi:diguanylate cyclase (GGDEF)-like protein